MGGQQRIYKQRIASTTTLAKVFRAMEMIAASRIGAAPPAAPAAPAAPVVSEVPDFSGASFTGGDAAPAALASEAPITPTPSTTR